MLIFDTKNKMKNSIKIYIIKIILVKKKIEYVGNSFLSSTFLEKCVIVYVNCHRKKYSFRMF